MKKYASIVLLLVCLLAALPVVAIADEAINGVRTPVLNATETVAFGVDVKEEVTDVAMSSETAIVENPGETLLAQASDYGHLSFLLSLTVGLILAGAAFALVLYVLMKSPSTRNRGDLGPSAPFT